MNIEFDNPWLGLGILALIGVGAGACAAYGINEARRETAAAQNDAWLAQEECLRSQEREAQLHQICNDLLQEMGDLPAMTYQGNCLLQQENPYTLEEMIHSLTA